MWHHATVMPIWAFLLLTQLWRWCMLHLETMISVSPFYCVTWWYQHMCYKCRWSSIYSNHAKKMCTIDMSVSVTPVAILLLWCSSSVLAYPDAIACQVIYVNSCNGTFNKSCWNGGEEMPSWRELSTRTQPLSLWNSHNVLETQPMIIPLYKQSQKLYSLWVKCHRMSCLDVPEWY